MEENVKVFSSTIQRSKCKYKNDLYDLIKIEPAEPLVILDIAKNYDCEFIPRAEKYYVPKRRSKLKVKTVRDVRKCFEDDIYSYLPGELERQQHILLRKIRDGSSGDDETKVLAKKLLESETPISRSAWQMLININPEQKPHPKQFLQWNRKYIQVNGSKGGKDKYITGHNKRSIKNKNIFNEKVTKKSKGMLKNSLSVKFKPGPLGRKKYLDDSHQKYHVGDIELVNLPKPGLDIQPTLGTSLEPTITYFINNLRNEDGIISQRWAELAVSVLGAIGKSDINQIHKDCITFELMYKYDQHRILMRRDVDSCNIPKSSIDFSETQKSLEKYESDVLPEIEDIMSKMIDSVEITLNQDNMYTNDDINTKFQLENIEPEHTNAKDRLKRKYCELNRLDVTVIRVPGESRASYTENCQKTFCSLGCVCDSIRGTFNFKRHCGRLDCMFLCKCDFSKYKNYNPADMDCEFIPGLLNLDSVINVKLSKEEQKFHQTVIVTDEKSIHLKSQKRNTKAPKKYADFYKNMNFKQEEPQTRVLSIIAAKLDCSNIEPWCMVHNVYKCFCKGKFTQSHCASNSNESIKDCLNISISVSDKQETTQSEDLNNTTTEIVDQNIPSKNRWDITISHSTCSRVIPYEGRKYTDSYYKITNDKILKMERNDLKMHQKLMNIYSGASEDIELVPRSIPDENVHMIHTTEKNNSKKILHEKKSHKSKSEITTNADLDQILTGIDEVLTQPDESQTVFTRSKSRRLPNKTKLVAWLECNYKMFKERVDRGITKINLEPPKVGKVALYPWDFILNRYRERKNIFLISRSKPIRIFMAVDSKSPTFENCMNINDIRFAELHNYPVTVKNLLTNATDLKDNFCILCGLSVCWEVIGSVTKVNDASEDDASEGNPLSTIEPFNINSWEEKSEFETNFKDSPQLEECQIASHDDKQSPEISEDDDRQSNNVEIVNQMSTLISNPGTEGNTIIDETSKWFVMTVENDFSEIRFYKRGFFVKYENIVKAIKVARVSGKTVRLSSQKCVDKNNGPQFGIYAIPNANEHCVFVGPYDIDQSLGIETIKTILDVRKLKRTRGFWITTSKVDNLKVIDNPLSFMPQHSPENKVTVTLDNSVLSSSDTESHEGKPESSQEPEKIQNIFPLTHKNNTKKIVKPIKIRKTNGFYHLASNGMIKKISSPASNPLKSLLLKPCPVKNIDVSSNLVNASNIMADKLDQESNQHMPELPIKITSVYTTSEGLNTSSPKKSEIGMFILKPEEINQKLFGNKLDSDLITTNQLNHTIYNNTLTLENKSVGQKDDNYRDDKCTSSANQRDQRLEMDVENFILDSLVAIRTSKDVCVISDEEDNTNREADQDSVNRRQVWIESLNAGLVQSQGKRKSTAKLKCKVAEAEKEIDNEDNHTDLQSPSTSKEETHTPGFPDIKISNVRTYSRAQNTRPKAHNSLSQTPCTSVEDTPVSPSGSLPDEDMPWNQPISNSSQILETLTNSSENVKSVMSAALKDIMSMAKQLDNVVGFELRYSED